MNGYLYDPHTHTAQTSICGHLDAADMVDRYVKCGFSGLVVTDHLHPEYLSRIDTAHNWDRVIDHFLSGYRAAKAHGDTVNFDVILGVELRFPENENDYLVYGIDEQWLRANPYICCMSAQEFYDKFHNEVLIIHAHPFREDEGSDPTQETTVHGAEIINAHPRHSNRNDKAWNLCCRNSQYLRLAGSDTHRSGDEARAGVLLPERVSDSRQYKHMIESMQFHLWGPDYYDLIRLDENRRAEEHACM